ncbi:MAG: hypothetical protein IPN32_32315 [Deltaproteobacteria bacterium]|nr:hypothetical protein [Deltaproteobacteria bacterium]
MAAARWTPVCLVFAIACGRDPVPAAVQASATRPAAAPVERAAIPPAVAITKVAAGGDSTCAASSTGRVHCAGRIIGDAEQPRAIPVGDVVDELAVADGQACARTHAGAVECWRAPAVAGDAPVVARVDDIHDATALAVRDEVACAKLAQGRVRCWGRDTKGPFTAELNGLIGAKAIAFDGDAVIVHAGDGKVRHYDPRGAVLERDNDGDEIAGLVGTGRGCVIYRGALRCSGDHFEGTPLDEGFMPQTTHVAGVCGSFGTAEIRCSSWNRDTPAAGRRWSTFLVPDATVVTTGNHHACALTKLGALWCWGRGAQGQLGERTPELLPTDVTAKFR